MEKLKQDLKKAREVVKDYNKLKHIFSNDEGVKTLAELNQTLGRIQMRLDATDVKELAHPKNKAIEKGFSCKPGALVKIRPCSDEYKDKTFVGFYIGDIALSSSISLTDEKKIQLNFSRHNPAIFVPELREIIYGCESWWGEIESIDDLKDITNEDIDNVWYVKLMKAQLSQNKA